MLPLLFVCVSQHRPLRVRNPIRCNRRILSQPCFHRSYSPRYPFGAPLRSHLLYLSVPFLSALRNVLCKTSMINTLFLIAFAYSYSSTGNPDCQCSFCCHAIVNVYNGILYKVIFITYIRGYKSSIVTRVSRFVNEFHILKATFKFCTRLSTFVMTFPFFSLLL